jgi:hypothetical protein
MITAGDNFANFSDGDVFSILVNDTYFHTLAGIAGTRENFGFAGEAESVICF